MSPDASDNLKETLISGTITQATQVEKFEQQLQEWFEYPYILSINSGRSE